MFERGVKKVNVHYFVTKSLCLILLFAFYYRMLDAAVKCFSEVKSFNFPKFHHAVSHLLHFVERAGSPNNGRAGVFEISHQAVHDMWDRTNKRHYVSQITSMVPRICFYLLLLLVSHVHSSASTPTRIIVTHLHKQYRHMHTTNAHHI